MSDERGTGIVAVPNLISGPPKLAPTPNFFSGKGLTSLEVVQAPKTQQNNRNDHLIIDLKLANLEENQKCFNEETSKGLKTLEGCEGVLLLRKGKSWPISQPTPQLGKYLTHMY